MHFITRAVFKYICTIFSGFAEGCWQGVVADALRQERHRKAMHIKCEYDKICPQNTKPAGGWPCGLLILINHSVLLRFFLCGLDALGSAVVARQSATFLFSSRFVL
jgi:hypothetical protein